MKMVELKWKKRKDGSIVTIHGDSVYRIFPERERTMRLYDIWTLTRDRVRVYVTEGSTGKLECKRVASRLAAGAKPLFERILKDLNEKDQAYYKQWIGYLDGKNHPQMPGPQKEKFEEVARKGVYPSYPVGLEFGIDRKELGHDYLLSLQLELWPIYVMAQRKIQKEAMKKRSKEKKVESSPTTLLKRSPEVVEQYTGPPPKEQYSSKLVRYYAVRETYPHKLKNAKWKTIRVWAYKVRKYFYELGLYPTVTCLMAFIHSNELKTPERKRKAAMRLKSIYMDEYLRDRAQTEVMIQKSLSVPKEEAVKNPAKKAKRKKDRFGNKEGTKAYKINQVLIRYGDEYHTAKWLAKKVGIKSISSHLTGLYNGNFLKKKIRDDKPIMYRLKTPEEMLSKPKKKKRKVGK